MILITKPFLNIPAGAIFTKYLQSLDMFNPTKINYTVTHKGKSIAIPAEYCKLTEYSDIQPIPMEPEDSPLTEALNMIKEMEALLFKRAIIEEQNKYRTFMEKYKVKIDCGKTSPDKI